MKPDTFGPKLLELFTTTPTPLTSSEAAEIVGCSNQRAYAWMELNRRLLISRGKGRHGAHAWIARKNPVLGHAVAAAMLGSGGDVNGSGDGAGQDGQHTGNSSSPAPLRPSAPAVIEAGVQLEVLGITVSAGKVVVSMIDPEGRVAKFRVAESE